VGLTIRIHPNCRERVIEITRKALGDFLVQHDIFPNLGSMDLLAPADSALRSAGKVREDLHEMISDSPFADFVMETLSKELPQNRAFNASKTLKFLSQVDGYADTGAVAQRLVEEFESLPWNCAVAARLPASVERLFAGLSAPLGMCDGIRILSAAHISDLYPSSPKSQSWTSGLLGSTVGAGADGIFLEIMAKGFVSRFGISNTEERVLSLHRAILGLAISRGLLTPAIVGGFAQPEAVLMHEQRNGRWHAVGPKVENGALGAAYRCLALSVYGDEEKNRECFLTGMRDICSLTVGTPEAHKVLLAAEWLFNSCLGSDELLAFVQTMVVLEILLGDKAKADQIGLGELLRNRCAYLIAETHTEREAVLNTFNEIYAIRSHIVHSGKKRLNSDERQLFNQLRGMCFRVLLKEVHLIRSDLAARSGPASHELAGGH
jgi:hypothetical protein